MITPTNRRGSDSRELNPLNQSETSFILQAENWLNRSIWLLQKSNRHHIIELPESPSTQPTQVKDWSDSRTPPPLPPLTGEALLWCGKPEASCRNLGVHIGAKNEAGWEAESTISTLQKLDRFEDFLHFRCSDVRDNDMYRSIQNRKRGEWVFVWGTE